jgi:hypothetical protein
MAVANGVRPGRKPTLTHHQQQEAIKRCAARKETQGEIALVQWEPLDDFEVVRVNRSTPLYWSCTFTELASDPLIS